MVYERERERTRDKAGKRTRTRARQRERERVRRESAHLHRFKEQKLLGCMYRMKVLETMHLSELKTRIDMMVM